MYDNIYNIIYKRKQENCFLIWESIKYISLKWFEGSLHHHTSPRHT